MTEWSTHRGRDRGREDTRQEEMEKRLNQKIQRTKENEELRGKENINEAER